MQEKSTTTLEFEVVEEVIQGQSATLQAVDISGASEILVRFRKPGNTIVDYAISLTEISFVTDGTDGLVRKKFTVAEAVAGEYDVQVFVEWGVVSEFWSDVKSFFMKSNLPSIA